MSRGFVSGVAFADSPRYCPYNWHRITEGKSYTLINDIDKVYARFPIVKAELENVLLAPLVYESPMQRLKNRTQ